MKRFRSGLTIGLSNINLSNIHSLKKSLHRRQATLIFHLLLPALYFGAIAWFLSLHPVFQFDHDEGIAVARAASYLQGFRLYTQIWNDQPPLFTVMLANWLHVFGASVTAARLMVALFSTLLIWSFSQILRQSFGGGPALVGVLLLTISWKYVILSISVMSGLVAIALAMLSAYLLLHYQKHRSTTLLLLSGLCFGLSLQTKFFTVLIGVPLFIQFLCFCGFQKQNITSQEQHRLQTFYPAFFWAVSCSLTFVLIAILLQSIQLEQLLTSHLSPQVQQQSQEIDNFNTVPEMLLQDGEYLVLAVFGLWNLVRPTPYRTALLVPLVWLVFITGVLGHYQPLWYHYYLLFSIPLVWLAVSGIVAIAEWVKPHLSPALPGKNRRALRVLLIVFLVGVLGLGGSISRNKLRQMTAVVYSEVQAGQQRFAVVERVAAYKAHTRWVFADAPMLAFRAGLPVPPETAVFSRKRLWGGNLSDGRICEILRTYRPEQIVISRFPLLEPEIQACIGGDRYRRRVYQGDYGPVIHLIAPQLLRH